MALLVLTGCTGAGTDPRSSPDRTGTASSPSPPDGSPGVEVSESPEAARPRLQALGHSALGGDGFNGDVWAHEGHAYVGVWGGVFQDADCPATGVKVASLRNPARPRLVARLRNPRGTTAEDVVVRSVTTPRFGGDLAAVGIQPCDAPAPGVFRGLLFFDVTRPARPRLLGRWAAPEPTIGCHEIDLAVSIRGRVLAGCADGGASGHGHDEVAIVDATDPRRPRKVGGYSAGVANETGVGCLRLSLAHSVRFDDSGSLLAVSYWDHGTVLLDVRRPARPRVMGRVRITPRSPDGDNHSVAFAAGGLLLVTSEDFSPAPADAAFEGCPGRFGGWGRLYVFDVTRPRAPRRLSTFGTPSSKRNRAGGPAIYSVHNAEVVGDQVFASWFSDGVRWLDLSRPTRPREVASFVPPARRDPHGFFGKAPLVWGVKPVDGTELVVASDINSGLWVLRATGLDG